MKIPTHWIVYVVGVAIIGLLAAMLKIDLALLASFSALAIAAETRFSSKERKIIESTISIPLKQVAENHYVSPFGEIQKKEEGWVVLDYASQTAYGPLASLQESIKCLCDVVHKASDRGDKRN